MKCRSLIPFLLLLLASIGLIADNAQAHLHVSSGEIVQVMMCGAGTKQTIKIEVPGEPVEETDTCCGDCISNNVAIEPPIQGQFRKAIYFLQPEPSGLPIAVYPNSPLWPGAPPHGPPYPSV